MAAHWNGAPKTWELVDIFSRLKIERNSRTMKLLARCTMTVFRIQWFLPTQLIPDFAAVATGFIASVEVRIVVMNLVGCSMLPLVVFAFGISFITIIAIVAVCRSLFSHGSSTGVELKDVNARNCSGCWTDMVWSER